jgi:hypothetical protein
MTYYQKEWNLYVANFLMKETVNDEEGKILSESHYICVELFRYDNPEEAYKAIMAMVNDESLSYKYRHEGNIVELKCVGLNDLDLLQTNIDKIKDDMGKAKTFYSLDIATVNLEGLNKDVSHLIKKKDDLSLFDEDYNYTL